MKKEDREKLGELMEKIKDNYVYIKSQAKYYSPKFKKFFKVGEVASNMMISLKDLSLLREGLAIKTYDNLCYYRGGKKGCYNLLDDSKILLPSENPTLDPNIKKLIENVCGYKKENIEYLHKLILYKYMNLNHFNIPAVVFYGAGGSGKGTIVSLFGTIIGEENVLANLGQQDLNSSFSTYKGQKFIVEFAEVTNNNTGQDIKNLNKLKNMILAPKIIVNEKGIQPYEIENTALFIISSNSEHPLKLDEKEKGNRRFSVIKSLSPLSTEDGRVINNIIRNKESVSNYLCWLMVNYSEVLEMSKFDPLDNEDKRELEEKSRSEANDFWDWFEDNFPNKKGKIPFKDLEPDMGLFLEENPAINKYEFYKFFCKNSKYPKKRLRIKGQKYKPYGFYIK